jgi:PLD-like domain
LVEVDVRFLGQPFPSWSQLGSVLTSALGDPEHTKFWAAVAWAKRSGLSRLAPELQAFRKRGGTSELLIGVDEGGATLEGLKLAISLFDQPFIFHDPGARTFHPKLYVIEGDAHATAVIGSGNLTRGGLYTNYECALALELDVSDSEDAGFLADLRAYYELLAAEDACRSLDDKLFAEIASEPRLMVRPEGSGRRRSADGSRGNSGQPKLFGKPVAGLQGAPRPTGAPADEDTDSLPDNPLPTNTGPGAIPAAGQISATPGAQPNHPGFFKQLSNNDASLVGSPGQIIIPIGFLPFFGELTVSRDESKTGGPRQLDADLAVTFRDGRYSKGVPTARVILYEPASSHKRKNSEVRFTFRDREGVSSRLSAGDVLAFRRQSDGRIVVERHDAGWRPVGWAGSGHYGLL